MKTLLAHLWQGATNTCIVSIKNKNVKHHWVKNADEAQHVVDAESKAGADVYFAPASFDSHERKGANVDGVAAFWLDIDCGAGKAYPSWVHGLSALLQWATAHHFWRPSSLIKSGNGLHVYWLLDQHYPRDDWSRVAQHLKQALKLANVDADPSRTADSASLLRVPGTFNQKDPANPLPVIEIFTDERRLSLDTFQSRLPKVGPVASVARPSAEWDIPVSFPPGDGREIAKRCAQIKLVAEAGGAVEEPLWRAALSIAKRCADAEQLIAEWSSGDPRYVAAEALEKANRTAGPATCTHFDSCNTGVCDHCRLRGQITSPIQIAVPEAPPKPEDNGRMSSVGMYRVLDEGLFFQPPSDADNPTPVRVAHVPIWVVEIRERARHETEAGASSLLLEWIGVDGRRQRAAMTQSHVYDMKSFKIWLADHNLISAITEVKLLVTYISQYTLKLLKRDGSREFHESLGWYQSGFVLGASMVTNEGLKPSLVQTGSPVRRLAPKGDVDAWAQGMSVLAKPQYAHHAFCLLAGFGSPLLHLAGVQSAVVSLAGVSGAGKTLSAKAALSIYGDPDLLSQGATATANAIEVQLAANRHVPYLLDEVTHLPPNRLTDFVYLAANGAGKAALSRARNMREAGSWQLVPFITSNRPLLEMQQSEVIEAHRRRVLELWFGDPMQSEDGVQVMDAVQKHMGSAGVVYLQKIAAMRDQIPALFQKTSEAVLEQVDIPAANRFALWTLSAAVLGGTIAKGLGLITFDPMQVAQSAMGALKDAVEDTVSDEERLVDALREYLTHNSRRVCQWRLHATDMGLPVDDAVARDLGNNTVALMRKEFNQILQDHKISKGAIRDWMRMAVRETTTMRLAPGVPPVWVHIIDLEYLGVTDGYPISV